MKGKRMILVLGIAFLLIAFSLFCRIQWQLAKPLTDTQLMHEQDTPFEIAEAFATALRKNNSLVYELAHPDLWPRLDDWMTTHVAKHCSRHNSAGMIQGEAFPKFSIVQNCTLENGEGLYTYKVKVFLTQSGDLVRDWSEVDESLITTNKN